MLTLHECLLNSKKVFARQSEESKNANIAILNYIKHLSDTASVNITAWDIGVLFSDKTNKKASLELIKNRNEINKIFFAEAEKNKAQPNDQINNVEVLLKNQLGIALKKRQDDQRRRLENDLQSRERDLNQYWEAINGRIANIIETRKQLAQLNNVSFNDKIISDIKELLLGNFYDFHSMEGSIIHFKTKNDIINKLIKPSAGLNITVNLGKFRIALNMETMKLQVFPFSDNIPVNRTGEQYTHPHVSYQGNICWGNVSERAAQCLINMDVKNVMLLLATLLTTYNEDNPYVPLVTFKDEFDKIEQLKSMNVA